ncbi:MAG: thiamine pyrophosphate-binding protein [Spirochaetia bacterium]|nr:thiamine pyrophosphate-binding protein [Spirochaetia bacterium]
MNGGELTARVLQAHNVKFLFTLIGGHISPIVTACETQNIRVIDVRHEVTAVFAADAVSRLTGTVGVAAVTAGPGLTNTITAVKNAQLAQSPLLLIGGATATILKNRGSLQDVDQKALMAPHVKWQQCAKRVIDIPEILVEAFFRARDGVPGPVFVELPVDLLYDHETVRSWYLASVPKSPGLVNHVMRSYLSRHVEKLFKGFKNELGHEVEIDHPPRIDFKSLKKTSHTVVQLSRVLFELSKCKRPVLVVGSQATLQSEKLDSLSASLRSLGIPTYLAGMARGLMGQNDSYQFRHRRAEALRAADLVILAGQPVDFRLNYGAHINRRAFHISINLSTTDLKKNKRPNLGIHADPADFLIDLARHFTPGSSFTEWHGELLEKESQRNQEIVALSKKTGKNVNPIDFAIQLNQELSTKSIVVVDGGDFVATSSYVIQPRAPLSWLDPGLFGTLGVGAGFALGAKLVHPDRDVWIMYGDGSCGFSLMEYDTFVRHGIGVIGIVGNDGCWTQIHRDQIAILKKDTACMLARSNYHQVAEALGAKGFLVKRPSEVQRAILAARKVARSGKPSLVNVMIDRSDFRKGSISM